MKNYAWVTCWGCGKEYHLDSFGMQETNVKCSDCGGTVISNSGKVQFKWRETRNGKERIYETTI